MGTDVAAVSAYARPTNERQHQQQPRCDEGGVNTTHQPFVCVCDTHTHELDSEFVLLKQLMGSCAHVTNDV